jgi:hypothetical protein
LAKTPVSLAIQGADNPGAGETTPTRIFSATEISSMKTHKRQAAATANRFFIPNPLIIDLLKNCVAGSSKDLRDEARVHWSCPWNVTGE